MSSADSRLLVYVSRYRYKRSFIRFVGTSWRSNITSLPPTLPKHVDRSARLGAAQ